MTGNYLTAMGIDRAYQTKTFENFVCSSENQRKKVAELKNLVDNWQEEKTKGTIYLLLGTTGTGKTHLSCAVFNALEKELHYQNMGTDITKGLFINSFDLFSSIWATYKTDSKKSEADAIKEYKKKTLLCIDEFGLDDENPKILKRLYAILNGRIEAGVPTIITSNMNEKELENYTKLKDPHGRLYSRIFSRENVILSFNWADYRING